jgi:uncharacterized protein (DUF1778 family)
MQQRLLQAQRHWRLAHTNPKKVRQNTVQNEKGAVMTTTTARLDLRLSARDKSRIARAAALRGMPVATFVRDTVLREVDAAIAAESTAMLSDEESRRFLAALDAPFTPNERLQHAMQAAAQLQPR